jgi:hypothetical protein
MYSLTILVCVTIESSHFSVVLSLNTVTSCHIVYCNLCAVVRKVLFAVDFHVS